MCLGEINYLRTGYVNPDLLDVHIITDEDVERKTSFAAKIHTLSLQLIAAGTLAETVMVVEEAVRTGNAAYHQKQHDIYGAVMDVIWQTLPHFARRFDHELSGGRTAPT